MSEAPPLRQPWRALRRLAVELRTAIPLCTAVALFFTLSYGSPFITNLVFSLCIGLSIQFLVNAGRYGMPAAARRLRPGSALARSDDWPGWVWMTPWVIAAAALGYYFGAHLAGIVLGIDDPMHWMERDRRAIGTVLLVTMVVAVGATYFFYSRARVAGAEAQAQAARRTAAESKLRLLESQLEPHMLFNTLANLRVLIGKDAAQAQRMLDHLIAFLRATLAASRSSVHTLDDEFGRVQDYLALMAVRMGPRLQVRLDLPDELRAHQVPPLLLQPLVENGIRHGLEPQRAGGRIEVAARLEGEHLILIVRDTGGGPPEAGARAGTGFGLTQVRERLRTLYGDAARLTLASANDADGGTIATIELPARQDPT